MPDRPAAPSPGPTYAALQGATSAAGRVSTAGRESAAGAGPADPSYTYTKPGTARLAALVPNRPAIRIAQPTGARPARPTDPVPVQRSPGDRASTTPSAKTQRIAAAAGAAPEVDAAGQSTVIFREPDVSDGGPSVRSALSAAVQQAPSVSAAPARAVPGRPAEDPAALDELYEQLLERLRRDLLIERERTAGLGLDLY